MASRMDWAMRGFGGEENQERGARERTGQERELGESQESTRSKWAGLYRNEELGEEKPRS